MKKKPEPQVCAECDAQIWAFHMPRHYKENHPAEEQPTRTAPKADDGPESLKELLRF